METSAQPAIEVKPTDPSPLTQEQAVKQDPIEQFGWLPCVLSLEIPIAKFTVGDLLQLSKGSILESASHYTSDIPLKANGLLIGWTEFEVIGNRLAARITELA
jgi:flagellar motor switch/type III secretory pathway protein FliN